MNRFLTCFLASMLILLAAPNILNAADFFLGVHFGAASVRATDTDIKLDQTTIGKGDTSETVVVMGLRLGAWLESIPALGAAVDGTMNYHIQGSELYPINNPVSFSVLALYRISFKESSRYPNGRIQTYIALGPGLFITDIYEYFDSPSEESELFVDDSVDLGLDARVGMTWKLNPKSKWTKQWSVFTEYRYTQFETEYKNKYLDGTLRFSPELKSHSLLFGYAIGF